MPVLSARLRGYVRDGYDVATLHIVACISATIFGDSSDPVSPVRQRDMHFAIQYEYQLGAQRLHERLSAKASTNPIVD